MLSSPKGQSQPAPNNQLMAPLVAFTVTFCTLLPAFKVTTYSPEGKSLTLSTLESGTLRWAMRAASEGLIG
jgi:hypothetical protein